MPLDAELAELLVAHYVLVLRLPHEHTAAIVAPEGTIEQPEQTNLSRVETMEQAPATEALTEPSLRALERHRQIAFTSNVNDGVVPPITHWTRYAGNTVVR